MASVCQNIRIVQGCAFAVEYEISFQPVKDEAAAFLRVNILDLCRNIIRAISDVRSRQIYIVHFQIVEIHLSLCYRQLYERIYEVETEVIYR